MDNYENLRLFDWSKNISNRKYRIGY